MKDINYPLRKAYYAALQATGLPVYYQSLPNNINPENYIVFRSINSNDDSTKTSALTQTNITVEIHTLKDIMNPGLDADTIAGEVFNYIYNISQFVLPMDENIMLATKMSNDTVQNIQLNHQKAYISRFITFQHHIFVSSDSGGGTPSGSSGTIGNYSYQTSYLQTSATITALANKKILLFSKDGIIYSPIITTGTPVNKQLKYIASSGEFSWAIPAEAGEEIFIVYQNL